MDEYFYEENISKNNGNPSWGLGFCHTTPLASVGNLSNTSLIKLG